MGATIRIDEGDQISLGRSSAGVPGWAWTRLPLFQESDSRVAGDDISRKHWRAVVHHDHFEQVAVECLCLEAAQAGRQPIRLIKVRNNHRDPDSH
jgi:hypothetical protein